jgi:TatA/E family protein of Tat protein translocase
VPIGPTELILILVIVLVIFGAGKLPQVFRSLGTGIREFREAAEGKETPTTTTTTTTAASNPGPTTAETPTSETPTKS